MMEEKQGFFAADGDSDATLVTPRFDDVEAETARPVVPLADVPPGEGNIAGAPVYAANPPKRRSWTLALVVISALVGTVLGGAGLRLYQQRQRAVATVAAEQTTPAQVEAAQPSPSEELVEEREAAVLPATATASAIIVEDPGDGDESPAPASGRNDREDVEKRDDSAKPRNSSEKERDAEKERNAERKKKDDDDDRDAKPDKDKTPKPRRVDVLTGTPSAVGTQVGQSEEAESEPQQIDREREEIVNERRQRRQERRERRVRQQRDVDRVRGIFEGQP